MQGPFEHLASRTPEASGFVNGKSLRLTLRRCGADGFKVRLLALRVVGQRDPIVASENSPIQFAVEFLILGLLVVWTTQESRQRGVSVVRCLDFYLRLMQLIQSCWIAVVSRVG